MSEVGAIECVRGLPVYSVSPPSPPSVETMPQRERSPPLAESQQQSKDISSFSSCTSSPWDSPENPCQALHPAPARAQSAPLTLPAEPLDPIKDPGDAGPPKGADAFSAVAWSQSQWIAFNDSFSPPRRPGSTGSAVKETLRPASGPGRAGRFLSDDSADAYCKAEGGREDCCFSDIFCGVTDRVMAAVPSGKIFNGNSITNAEIYF